VTQEAGTPPDFWRRIEQVAERAVAKYARSGALRNSRISGGNGLTIADGGKFRAQYPADQGGDDAFYVGDIFSASNPDLYLGTGVLIQAPNGNDMATFRSDAQFGTTMHNIYDSNNNIIFGNDAASAQGLARPYVPGAFYRARYADWTVSTSAGTFETLWATRMLKQHPKLEVGVRASMDTSGATGELRVLVNGQQLGAISAVEFVLGYFIFGAAAVAGDHMAALDVEIQARRTSASGAVRVEPWYAPLGRQS
jgi:hypothetical protein